MTENHESQLLPAAKKASGKKQQETSIKIFRRFVTTSRVNADTVVVDASAVVSRECYEAWLRNKTASVAEPDKAFQRCISSHVTAVDGRQPFYPNEEEAILKVLRKKQIWYSSSHLQWTRNSDSRLSRPAFENTASTVGCKGFRAQGFHERVVLESRRGESYPNEIKPPVQKQAILFGQI